MPWRKVAEGTSFEDLEALVADRELAKGDRLRVVMDTRLPIAWAFDIAPNWMFPAPEGMSVVDIWGEGTRTGMVEMEADPAWFLAILTFLKAHWLAIVIGGAILGLVITSIIILAWIITAIVEGGKMLLALTAAAAGVGMIILAGRRRK